MNKIIIMILVTLVTVNIAQEKLSLNEAISISLENNYGIKIAEYNLETSKNNASPANAGLLPRLDFSAGVNYNDNTTKTAMGEVNQQSTYNNAGLSLSYTLFDGFANIKTYKRLKEVVKSGELQLQQTIEGTIYQLINAYYASVINYESVAVNKEMLEISKERLEKIKLNVKYGKSNGLDLLNAEVDFNNDSISYINAQNSYAESKRNLNQILSRDPDINFDVIADVSSFRDYDFSDLKNEMFSNNVSYKLGQNSVKQSEIGVGIARADYLPTLSLNSSYGYNQTANNLAIRMDDPNTNFSAGLTLSFNIFNGGRTSRNVENSQIALKSSKLQLEDTRLELYTRLENDYSDYVHNHNVYKTNQSNLKASESNFLRSQEYFGLGQITSTQFREAQLNYTQAKLNIVISKISAKLSEVNLIYLTGNILE